MIFDEDDSPQHTAASEVAATLIGRGHVAYYAGGCVRDRLMGRQPTDYDVATDAPPELIIQIFGRRHTLAIGAAFGVVAVRRRVGEQTLWTEVATFRNDGAYVDGRRPTGVEYSSPLEDAQRRDFTINGLFYDPQSRQVLDYVGGQRDIVERRIRAIGVPSDRFAEDKLRMVRAIRFAAKFRFRIEGETRRAIADHADELPVVSAERLADELRKMAAAGGSRVAWAMQQMYRLRLLPAILPATDAIWQNDRRAVGHSLRWLRRDLAAIQSRHCPTPLAIAVDADASLVDLLACCLRPLVQTNDESSRELLTACRHLKLSNELTGRVTFAVTAADRLIAADRLLWSQVQPLVVDQRFGDAWRLAVRLAADHSDRWEGLRSICKRIEQSGERSGEQLDPPPLLDGADLRRLGLPPGPLFGRLLSGVRARQLDGELRTAEEAAEWARGQVGD